MPQAGLTRADENPSVQDGQESRTKEHKVVVHLRSGSVLKGLIACGSGDDPALIFEKDDVEMVEVRLVEATEWMRIPLAEVKAIFFVKSFRGDAKRKALHFYSNGPDLGPIWAEIRFDDHEVLEGKVENTARHLLGSGFVVRPTDLGGNNLLVYVNKRAVQSYRVLGVRTNGNQHG